jgi:hypothetical protein
MQEERYSPKSFDGGIAAAFGASTERRGAMPTTTISGEERDVLYTLVRDHLDGVGGDIRIALEGQRDFIAAKRLGRDLCRDVQMLDDLGWPEEDDRETVELTIPAEELTELVRRLHDEATGSLTDPPMLREERELEERHKRRSHLAQGVCARLLVELHETGGDPS